jgi:hypothetical protein
MTHDEVKRAKTAIETALKAPPPVAHFIPIGPALRCKIDQHGVTVFEVEERLMSIMVGASNIEHEPPAHPEAVVTSPEAPVEATPAN